VSDEEDDDGENPWVDVVKAAQKAEKAYYAELSKNHWEGAAYPIRIEVCDTVDDYSDRGNKTFVIDNIPKPSPEDGESGWGCGGDDITEEDAEQFKKDFRKGNM